MVLERVEGRKQDFIITGTGRLLPITVVNFHDGVTFGKISLVQFVQNEPGKIDMCYVPITPLSEFELARLGADVQSVLGDDMELTLGFSHPVLVKAPQDIQFELVTPTKIRVKGIDKQKVGELAAKIRALRKPDPYKGKGIRYTGEYVRRKAGKTAV